MKRVLITRPRSQANSFADALSQAGFEPAFLPVIEIHLLEENPALERALGKLACYDWIVFTSVNGVEAFWTQMQKQHIENIPAQVRIAAIGPKTAEALSARGAAPVFIPETYVAEAILPGLGDLKDRWVLLPRAEIARKALPEAIAQAGGIAHEIAVYRTLPTLPDPLGLAALAAGVDVVTLTSPSCVQNFFALARQNGLDPLALPGSPLFACIGPITEQEAREQGIVHLVTAEKYTTEGLVHAIESLV